MRTMSSNLKVVAVIFLGILVACSAEDGQDGAIGPQGPQGEQGPQGPQGDQGPPGSDGQDGTDGVDGNANLISSGWLEIDTWTTDLPDFKFIRLPDLTLTEFQIENDLILVYRRYQPSPSLLQVELLPVTRYDTGGRVELSITSRIQGNGLHLQIEAIGRDVTADEYLPPETQFRYIIIPADGSSSKNRVNYFKMSYQEVVAYLNLKP